MFLIWLGMGDVNKVFVRVRARACEHLDVGADGAGDDAAGLGRHGAARS